MPDRMHIRLSNEEVVFRLHTAGVPYLSFRLLDEAGIPNLYSTRYENFDEKTGTGKKGIRTAVMSTDLEEEASPIVRANRDILAKQLGSSIRAEQITYQEHTTIVKAVGWEGAGKQASKEPVDGLVTNTPGILLSAFGGDCPPVYLADPVKKAVGLVHAGWRGTFGKIPEKALQKMTELYGTDPSDVLAAVGPGVCKDCYEMGDEIYDLFAEEWGKEDADRLLTRYPAFDKEGMPIPGGKYHLDLREANRMTLIRAGVSASNIAVSNICTMCNKDIFYSYRGGTMENEQTAMILCRFDR